MFDRRKMMHAMTRRVAHTVGVCVSALPPSTARWTRTLILPTGASNGSMTVDSISRPPMRAPDSMPSVPSLPEFVVPEEHVWVFDASPGTPDMFSLMAVPKRKVTPSRRKRRNQFKRIDFVTDVQRCRDCGKAKRPHVYCAECSTNIYDDNFKVGGGGASGSVVP